MWNNFLSDTRQWMERTDNGEKGDGSKTTRHKEIVHVIGLLLHWFCKFKVLKHEVFFQMWYQNVPILILVLTGTNQVLTIHKFDYPNTIFGRRNSKQKGLFMSTVCEQFIYLKINKWMCEDEPNTSRDPKGKVILYGFLSRSNVSSS